MCLYTPSHCINRACVQLGSQPVFAKHRDMLFFPTAAYAWTVTLLRIPYSLGVILPWCTLTYFSVGLTVSAGRYGPSETFRGQASGNVGVVSEHDWHMCPCLGDVPHADVLPASEAGDRLLEL